MFPQLGASHSAGPVPMKLNGGTTSASRSIFPAFVHSGGRMKSKLTPLAVRSAHVTHFVFFAGTVWAELTSGPPGSGLPSRMPRRATVASFTGRPAFMWVNTRTAVRLRAARRTPS